QPAAPLTASHCFPGDNLVPRRVCWLCDRASQWTKTQDMSGNVLSIKQGKQNATTQSRCQACAIALAELEYPGCPKPTGCHSLYPYAMQHEVRALLLLAEPQQPR